MTSHSIANLNLNVGRGSDKRAKLVALGIAASIFVHALLLTPLMLAGRASHPPPQPNSGGAGASSSEEVEIQAMILVVINDSQRSDLTTQGSEMPLPRAQVPLRRISVPDVSTFTRLDSLQQSSEANEDDAGLALVFGRYMGQVSARVMRTWARPRTGIEGGRFTCRVQINQDASGAVQEITLRKCTGDLRWQSSLVQAIQSASPLPVPPDPNVFSNVLTLQFESDEYAPGGSTDGYEVASTLSPSK